MAGKQHLEPAAFRMYAKGLDMKEIAATLGIVPQTLSGWRKKYDWDNRRAVYVQSTHATVDKLRKLLSDHVEGLEDLADDKDADKLVKITAAIQRLDEHFDYLGSVLKVSEEWITYASKADEQLFALLQDHLPDFLAHARTKYAH